MRDEISAEIEREFVLALVYFAKGELTPTEAQLLGQEVLAKVDLDSKYLAHKGLNWLAKKTIEKHLDKSP